RRRAAHVGRRCRRPGAGIDPDVHLHGRDPGAVGLGQGHAERHRGAAQTLSVIALPQMLAAGYDKRLAIGTIASAGTLGILIPPAIMLVVMAEMLQTSAGNLFLSAIMPGFLLSGLYLVYIVLVAMFKPGAAPKLPPGYGPQTRTAFWYALWRG